MLKKIFFGFLFGSLLIVGNFLWFRNSSRKISYYDIDKVPGKYTAIVFGAGLRSNGTPSSILQDRLVAGADLYKNGKVLRILVSGDNRILGYDEPEAMKISLINLGVPAEHIFLDYAGFDTYSTVFRAKNIFNVEDAILVSQQYHLDRALFIGRRLDMDVVGFSSDKRSYKNSFMYNFRELAARAKSQLDIFRHRKPHHLGEKVDIHGKSNAIKTDYNNK
jgi:SanA protein